jgi:hypothetical protein
MELENLNIIDGELNSASIDKDWGCLEFKNGLVDIEPKTLFLVPTFQKWEWR